MTSTSSTKANLRLILAIGDVPSEITSYRADTNDTQQRSATLSRRHLLNVLIDSVYLSDLCSDIAPSASESDLSAAAAAAWQLQQPLTFLEVVFFSATRTQYERSQRNSKRLLAGALLPRQPSKVDIICLWASRCDRLQC